MVLAVFSAGISSYFVLGLLSSKSVTSISNLNGIDVEFYRDDACTQKITMIDWGNVEPGKVLTKTFYLKNVGNTSVLLSMNISAFVPPSIKEFMSMSWDMEGLSLYPGESTPVTFSLTLNQLIRGIDEIDYNITISSVE